MSTGASTAPSTASRMTWLDANRALAALGVVLIHCTTDDAGQPFTASPVAERIGPAILRVVAELSGAELFLVFSLFLVAFKLDRRSLGYRMVIDDYAKRLLIPFLAWTLFFAFFRLLKANAFGYANAILGELGRWQSWVDYLLLGSAAYHLHFLPTLFALVLFFPVMLAAIRFPLAGLLLVPSLYVMDFVQDWLWGAVSDPLLRDCLVRAVRIFGYVGYGLAAFSLYGLWKRGLDRRDSRLLFQLSVLLIAIAVLATLVYAAQVAATGQWVNRPGAAFYAHLVMPALVFMAFLGCQHRAWSPRFNWFARFTFGLYLIHPVFVDFYDIAVHSLGWRIDPTIMVLTKFAFAVPASFAAAWLIATARPLAWLIGAGPVPFLHAGHRAQPEPTRA